MRNVPSNILSSEAPITVLFYGWGNRGCVEFFCGGTVEAKAEMALAPNQGHCLLSLSEEYPWDSRISGIRVPGEVRPQQCTLWVRVWCSAGSLFCLLQSAPPGNHLCRSHPRQLYLLCLELNSALGGAEHLQFRGCSSPCAVLDGSRAARWASPKQWWEHCFLSGQQGSALAPFVSFVL